MGGNHTDDRSATAQMLTSKRSMLLSAHAIYRGLQDSLQDFLHALPDNIHPNLKLGLLNDHCKLSDYYNKIDDSPFYTWASRMSPSSLIYQSVIKILTSIFWSLTLAYRTRAFFTTGTDIDVIHALSTAGRGCGAV